MRFKDNAAIEAYQIYYQTNAGDPYSRAVLDYTERWVGLLEDRIAPDATDDQVEAILAADDFGRVASHQADTEGITGFMFGCAVQALCRFWQHGEALRRWHNRRTQLKDEGERANATPGAVLNPAILTIGDDNGGGAEVEAAPPLDG